MKNIFDIFTEEHAHVRGLIIEAGATVESDWKKRDDIFAELKFMLEVHSRFEDEVAFPAMRRELGRDVVYTVANEREEHEQLWYLVSMLELMDSRSGEWMETITRLAFLFDRHARNEELIFFAQAREQLPPHLAIELADRYLDWRRHARNEKRAAG